MHGGDGFDGAALSAGAGDGRYFTDLSERTMHVIDMVEVELWKLGIPQTTRHKEVAPGQVRRPPRLAQSTPPRPP